MAPSRWIPLESNPEVMNSWAVKAGLVASQARFEDIYGLDDELLGMVSQPVKAIILLFPITASTEKVRKDEEEKMAKEGQHKIDPTVFWIKQTISNACGTIGLLHALANSDATFTPHSALAEFIEECQEKSPEERAKVLETTPLFANIHADAAASGQTAVPQSLDTDLHFTCFVATPDTAPDARANGAPPRLIELDGRRAGPIDRGEAANLLMDAANFVKMHYLTQTSSTHFSMIALTGGQ